MLHSENLTDGVPLLNAQQQKQQNDAHLYAAYQQQAQHQQQQLQVAPFNTANQMMMVPATVLAEIAAPTATVGVSLMTTKKRRAAACASSVLGRVTVTDIPTGQKVSQWCGTECYLSYVSGLGPCLVVRSSKHKRGDGTMFQLRHLEKVMHQNVEQGKLSIQIPHMKRKCMIFVEVTDAESLPHLALMARTLDDPRRWKDVEVNVGRGMGGGGGGGTRRGRPGKNQGGVMDGEEGEVLHTNKEARDAVLAQDDDEEFEFA